MWRPSDEDWLPAPKGDELQLDMSDSQSRPEERLEAEVNIGILHYWHLPRAVRALVLEATWYSLDWIVLVERM